MTSARDGDRPTFGAAALTDLDLCDWQAFPKLYRRGIGSANFTREYVSVIKTCRQRMMMTPPLMKKSLKSRCIVSALLIGALLGIWWIKHDPVHGVVLSSLDDSTLGPLPAVGPRALEDVSTLHLYTEEVTYFQDCGFKHQPGQIEVGRKEALQSALAVLLIILNIQIPAQTLVSCGSPVDSHTRPFHCSCVLAFSKPWLSTPGLHGPHPSITP